MLKIVLFVLILTAKLFSQTVQIHGALRSIMHGNLSANFNLQDLDGKQNIYGLGAVANLKVETIVIDSKAYLSQMLVDRVIMISHLIISPRFLLLIPLKTASEKQI